MVLANLKLHLCPGFQLKETLPIFACSCVSSVRLVHTILLAAFHRCLWPTYAQLGPALQFAR